MVTSFPTGVTSIGLNDTEQLCDQGDNTEGNENTLEFHLDGNSHTCYSSHCFLERQLVLVTVVVQNFVLFVQSFVLAV